MILTRAQWSTGPHVLKAPGGIEKTIEMKSGPCSQS